MGVSLSLDSSFASSVAGGPGTGKAPESREMSAWRSRTLPS